MVKAEQRKKTAARCAEMHRAIYIIFAPLSLIGELIFEKPGKLFYAFLLFGLKVP